MLLDHFLDPRQVGVGEADDVLDERRVKLLEEVVDRRAGDRRRGPIRLLGSIGVGSRI